MMITIGFLVPGFGYFVVSGSLEIAFIVLIPPLVIYGLMFITSVELPDMEADRISGKMTLIARKGRSFGYALAAVCTIVATAYFFVAHFGNFAGDEVRFSMFAVLSFLPLGAALNGYLNRSTDMVSASSVTTANIGSLMLFVALVDGALLLTLIL